MTKNVVRVIVLLTLLISIHPTKTNNNTSDKISTSHKECCCAKNTASLNWIQEKQKLLQYAGIGFISIGLGYIIVNILRRRPTSE